MKLVFLLEERSMKAFLEGLLPRLLPPGWHFQLIPHEGKSDLEKSVPRKLLGWQEPDVRFVIVRDQDRADCAPVRAQLLALCAQGGRPETLVRIACRELESWYLGDLRAVGVAYGLRGLAEKQAQAKYRDPDHLGSPSRELSALVPAFGKVDGARRLGSLVDLETNYSESFQRFVSGLRRLTAGS